MCQEGTQLVHTRAEVLVALVALVAKPLELKVACAWVIGRCALWRTRCAQHPRGEPHVSLLVVVRCGAHAREECEYRHARSELRGQRLPVSERHVFTLHPRARIAVIPCDLDLVLTRILRLPGTRLARLRASGGLGFDPSALLHVLDDARVVLAVVEEGEYHAPQLDHRQPRFAIRRRLRAGSNGPDFPHRPTFALCKLRSIGLLRSTLRRRRWVYVRRRAARTRALGLWRSGLDAQRSRAAPLG